MKQREPAVGWFQGARSGRAQTDGGTGGPRNGMQTPVAQTTQKSLMMTQSQTGILHSAQCEIRTDDLTRALYATDASIYQMRPEAVAFPQSARAAAAAFHAAVEAGIPATPRGAGTPGERTSTRSTPARRRSPRPGGPHPCSACSWWQAPTGRSQRC